MPEFTSLIRSLGECDPAERRDAAREIFERGVILGLAAAEKWLADTEFASLLVPGKRGLICVTVGIAVEHGTFVRISAASGSPQLANVPPDQDAKEFELDFSDGVRLDVLSPRESTGSGAIAKYLAKFGEGIQQVEIDVIDVDLATHILSERFSLTAIYPATRAGADDSRVNFFLVPVGQGRKILIELVERCGR